MRNGTRDRVIIDHRSLRAGESLMITWQAYIIPTEGRRPEGGPILGCGSIQKSDPIDEGNREQRTPAGAARLLQILLTESAHLIWVLRCERVIQEKTHELTEIMARWTKNINKRLTDDRIIATVIKRDKTTISKVRSTWENVLKKTWTLPNDWVQNREVLVGRRA